MNKGKTVIKGNWQIKVNWDPFQPTADLFLKNHSHDLSKPMMLTEVQLHFRQTRFIQ